MKIRIILLIAFAVVNMRINAQTGGIIVSPGTTITEESGSTIDITYGNLLLQDDYNSSPSFIQKGSLHFTAGGDAKVEQYLNKDRWHIISSPVQYEVNGAYIWMYLYKYVEPSNSFVYMNQPTTQPLNPGQGYYVWAYTTDPNGTFPPSADSAVLQGILNSQDINLTLTVTDSSPKSGWNLIGNPFPCGLNWNGNSDWNLTNLDATVWIWDPIAGNHKTWNYSTGIGTLQSGEIAATQGFWVHAHDTTGASATSLTLPASQRLHTTNDFYKNSQPELPNHLKLKVEGNTQENDETIIGFTDIATPEPNSQLDALYLEGSETSPSLYVRIAGNSYAVKELPDWETFHTVPIGFKAGIPGLYTLSADWTETFPSDLDIFLEDKKENYQQNLRINPQYKFAADMNDFPGRFTVRFGKQLSIPKQNIAQGVNIFSFERKVFLIIDLKDFLTGKCIIFDLTGRKVLEKTVIQGKNIIATNFERGYYLVTFISNENMVSKKIFITN